MVQIFSKISIIIKIPLLRFNATKISNVRFRSTDSNYPVKNVEICTLKNFYKERPDGLKFKVEYCDTKEFSGTQDVPTILAIHGSPGTHNDFLPYIEKLSKTLGVRFIAPNIPGFEATNMYPMYLHKVEEKAIYLNDFLKHIGVCNVDMLLTHSSGVYSSLYLWKNLRDMPDNRLREIGSFAFFSPPGYRRIKAMRPKWFTQSCGDFYINQYGRRLLRFTGAKIFKLMGVDMKLDNIDNLMVACITMNNTKEYHLREQFESIVNQKLPVFYSYSEDDRLIEKEIFYECLDLLNLNKNDIVLYNRETKLIQLGNMSKINKAIVFKKGGHYCFLKHNQIISNYLIDFIKENLCKRITNNCVESSISNQDETLIKLKKKQLNI